MNKLAAIRIVYEDGTYSDPIPITALMENIQWNESKSLLDVLGEDLNDDGESVKDKFDRLKSLVNNTITFIDNIPEWAKQPNKPTYTAQEVGALPADTQITVEVDNTLSIQSAAADAKKVGDELTQIKQDLEVQQSRAETAQALKINKPMTNPNGTQGQILQTDGQGGTVWVNKQTDEQIANAVTDWLDDHVVPGSSTIVVDDTLTIQGAAADAKKIGGELSALKEDSNVQTEILKLKRSIPISFTVEGTRYINASTGGLGASSTGSSFSHTDYIDIGSFTLLSYKKVYTTSSNPALGMAFYDASKVYISGEKAKGSGSGLGYVDGFIDVPENAKYARFTTINDTTSYGEFSIYAINPLDDEYDKKSSLYNNLWNYGEVVHGHSIDPRNGNLTDNNDYDVTDYIPVQEGNIIYGYGARFYCYDSDKNIVSGETGVLNSLATTLANGMKYYIIPSGASYFRICAQRTLEIYQFRLYLASPLEHIQESQTQRTIYTLGDSITRGMYAEIGTSSSSGPSPKGYPYWIGQANGYTVVNLGNSGSGWANVGSPESQDDPSTAYNAKGVVDNHTFDDADIITLAFGVNDWKGAAQNIALGDMTSTPGDGTVIGNMKYCIETLADPVNGKAKNAQIVVLLPLNTNRQWPGMDTMTLENNWAFGYAYRNNQTLDDYRTAIRECAEYYNLKVIDLEEVCPINRLNIRNVCGDGLHPTLAFHKQIGLALAPLIC